MKQPFLSHQPTDWASMSADQWRLVANALAFMAANTKADFMIYVAMELVQALVDVTSDPSIVDCFAGSLRTSLSDHGPGMLHPRTPTPDQ
jgi:hypothetical protein